MALVAVKNLVWSPDFSAAPCLLRSIDIVDRGRQDLFYGSGSRANQQFDYDLSALMLLIGCNSIPLV